LPPGAEKIDYVLPAKVVQDLCQKSRLFSLFAGPIILLLLVFNASRGFQILNPHNMPSSWVAVIVGKLRKIPVVWMVHNLPQKVSWKNKTSVFEYLLWAVGASWLDKKFIGQVDLILASSIRMRQHISSRYDKDSQVIPHGVDYELFSKGQAGKARNKWGLKRESFILLAARQMHPEKNLITLVRVLPKLIKEIPEVFLILAGEGPTKKACEEEAKRLRVNDKVLFTGMVSREDLADLYSVSGVNLMPSLEEPYGLTPFEALCVGIISVVSDKSGAAEILVKEKIGLACQPTEEGLVNKIKEIYKNREKFRQIAETGKVWVKKHLSTTNFSKEVLETMKEVAREKGDKQTLSSQLYDRKYFLSQCGGFEEFSEGGINSKLIYAYSLANIQPEMKVLDVGTGRGELAVKCAMTGAEVTAIDYSPAAIKIAKGNLKHKDNQIQKRVEFRLMNAKDLDFPDNSFDLVFLIDVVEHLYPEEAKQAFREIERVLKPGGKLILHTPNAWLINSLYFLAKFLFNWRKQEVHVNEQSFWSLRRNLKVIGGKPRVFFKQRRKYFSGALTNVHQLPSWTTPLASLLDCIFKNKFSAYIIYRTPLVYWLGSDLWAIVVKDLEN
jgi:glycosyltransferase involved in cell wall biosynthesis/precorrin-6B methylase 2